MTKQEKAACERVAAYAAGDGSGGLVDDDDLRILLRLAKRAAGRVKGTRKLSANSQAVTRAERAVVKAAEIFDGAWAPGRSLCDQHSGASRIVVSVAALRAARAKAKKARAGK